MKKKLVIALFATVMCLSLAACGGGTDSDNKGNDKQTESNADADKDEDKDADKKDDKKDDASSDDYVSSVTYGLNYGAEPEAFVGNWVLKTAYTAEAGDLAVNDTCTLAIETSIDANKLVDDAAYIHADAINLKGTLSFSDGTEYSCTGAWGDWTVVDVVGEGEAYFKGAIKFKIRDDGEGIFFDTLTGKTIEDMELFNVLGLTADGKLVLGYSEDHIEKAGDAEWAYAYVFEKQ